MRLEAIFCFMPLSLDALSIATFYRIFSFVEFLKKVKKPAHLD